MCILCNRNVKSVQCQHPVFLRCLESGWSGAHQPSRLRLNKLFPTLTISPPFCLPLTILSFHLFVWWIQISREVFVCQPPPIQEHTSGAGGVSFILHQKVWRMSASYVPVSLCLCLTNKHSRIIGRTGHRHQHTEGTQKEWQKKQKWGRTRAIKSERMLTLCVMTCKCAHVCACVCVSACTCMERGSSRA